MGRLLTISFAVAALTVTVTQPSRRVLKSISISPASATSRDPRFIATGKFSAPPEKVTPLPVSWFLLGPGIDPPPSAYTLTKGSHRVERCNPMEANPAELRYTVIALAPANPNAPRSGPIPIKVFEDLVLQHTKSEEGGFVAATAKLTCP